MRIGVLAVQGAFLEHEQVLSRLGVEWFELRQSRDLEQPMDGLILPGGESTVMGKLLRELELFSPLREKIEQGLPVFGTCAGLILLAQEISGDEEKHLATMEICAKRNAYGRQLGSFRTEEAFADAGKIPMVFIRAPYIERVWGAAEPLSTVQGNIVAARQGNQLATSFHPELTEDTTVHRYFLRMIEESRKKR